MIQALWLTLALLFLGLATSTSILKEWIPHDEACREELNLKYQYDPEDVEYNQTCLHKCSFEKSGKIDSDGNLDVSNFPDDEKDAAQVCWDLVEIDDLCKKITMVANCISRKINTYLQNDKCEVLYSYKDDMNSCYTRCFMIKQGNLLENGKVNFETFGDYDKEIRDHAEEVCGDLVKYNGNECSYDLDQYYCISQIMWRGSKVSIENEIKCSKENGDYPLYGSYDVEESLRHCYDRCVLVGKGDFNPDNIKESKYFIDNKMDPEKIEQAYEICKRMKHPEDDCLRDLYFYDCINFVYNSDEGNLNKQIECALETDTLLVNPRGAYTMDSCKARCLMVKEGQLGQDGNLNKTHLEKLTVDPEIIERSINYCKNYITNENTCTRDVLLQYCTNSKIYEEIYKKCSPENNQYENDDSSCITRCRMIHSRQLGLEGEILPEHFIGQNGKTEEDVRNAIEKCNAEVGDEKSCMNDLDRYDCVSLKLFNYVNLSPVYFYYY